MSFHVSSVMSPSVVCRTECLVICTSFTRFVLPLVSSMGFQVSVTAPLPAVAVRLAGVVGLPVGSGNSPSARSNVNSLLGIRMLGKVGVALFPSNTAQTLTVMDSSSKYVVSVSASMVNVFGKELAAKLSTAMYVDVSPLVFVVSSGT